jgi:hypothetical protein
MSVAWCFCMVAQVLSAADGFEVELLSLWQVRKRTK